MATPDSNWYESNATRAYPLDDAATGLADNGTSLAHDLIVDANIAIPRATGPTVFIGSATVTATTVALTVMSSTRPIVESLLATPGDPIFSLIGTLTIPAPATLPALVAIDPEQAGVSGWVVLGAGVRRRFNGRFSTPMQSALLPRCVSPYVPSPVSALTAPLGAIELTDVVQVKGGADLTITADTWEISGVTYDALIFSLRDDLDRNVQSRYIGPCGGRPEARTCAKPGIEHINGIRPDCAGNIDLTIEGATVTATDGSTGGLTILSSLTVGDLCGTADDRPDPETGALPDEPIDQCGAPHMQARQMPTFRVASGPRIERFEQGLPRDMDVQAGVFSTHQVWPSTWLADTPTWAVLPNQDWQRVRVCARQLGGVIVQASAVQLFRYVSEQKQLERWQLLDGQPILLEAVAVPGGPPVGAWYDLWLRRVDDRQVTVGLQLASPLITFECDSTARAGIGALSAAAEFNALELYPDA